jgi:hypothetical protein
MSPAPDDGQQVVEVGIRGARRQVTQEVPEVFPRVQLGPLRRRRQALRHGRRLQAAVAPDVQPVAATHRQRSSRQLGQVLSAKPGFDHSVRGSPHTVEVNATDLAIIFG